MISRVDRRRCLDELVHDVSCAVEVVIIGYFQEIREQEPLEDCKQDKQLQQDDFPQCPPQPHVAETIEIELDNAL